MWPFRRARRETRGGSRPEPVLRASRGEWRQVAPMPTVQTQRLTTVAPQFERDLATRANPSFLAPLGHHVVAEAPSGTVGGLAVPEPRSFANPAASLPEPRIVPGEPALPAAGGEPAVAASSPGAMSAPLAQVPAPRPLVQARHTDLPRFPIRAAPEPVRDAGPSVQRQPSDAASDAPAADVDAPEPEETAGPEDRGGTVEQTVPTVAQRAPLDPPAAPAAPSAASPLGAPRPAHVDEAGRGTSDATPTPTPSGTSGPSPRRTDPVRRPRIGAPIDPIRSASTPMQALADHAAPAAAPSPPSRADTSPRQNSPSSAPRAETDRPLLGDEPLTAGGGTLHAPAASHGVTSPPEADQPGPPVVAARLPLASDAVASSSGRDVGAPSAPDRSLVTDEPDQSAPAPSPADRIDPTAGGGVPDQPVTVPTLGAAATVPLPDGQAPLRPEPDDVPWSPVALSRGRTVSTAQRTLRGGQPDAAGSRGAAQVDATRPAVRTAQPAPPASLQRAAAGPPTSLQSSFRSTSPAGAPPASLPAAQVGLVGDRAGLVASERVAAAPSTGPSGTSGEERAVVQRASSVPQRVHDGPTRLAAAAAPRRESPVGQPVWSTSASGHDEQQPEQRSPVEIVELLPVELQRQVEAATAPDTAAPAASVTPTEPTTPAPAAEAAPRPPTEAEVQELVRALYPPLRRRLGRDLLLDRERSGYRTDIRF